MKKSNFYFRYRNVGVLPCILSILLVHYIVAKCVDYFGIILVKMSNILIAEIIVLFAFIGIGAVLIWFLIQLIEEEVIAWLYFDEIDLQTGFGIFFGKLVMQLIEKWRGKNDYKKL